MSLFVSVAVVVSEGDSELVKVIKTDTSINPNPDDQQASLLLVTALAERLVREAGSDLVDRVRELITAVENTSA